MYMLFAEPYSLVHYIQVCIAKFSDVRGKQGKLGSAYINIIYKLTFKNIHFLSQVIKVKSSIVNKFILFHVFQRAALQYTLY